ncbi:hypothetical protein SGRI78S_07309 [Streptomyces griseus subsp. griseus]
MSATAPASPAVLPRTTWTTGAGTAPAGGAATRPGFSEPPEPPGPPASAASPGGGQGQGGGDTDTGQDRPTTGAAARPGGAVAPRALRRAGGRPGDWARCRARCRASGSGSRSSGAPQGLSGGPRRVPDHRVRAATGAVPRGRAAPRAVARGCGSSASLLVRPGRCGAATLYLSAGPIGFRPLRLRASGPRPTGSGFRPTDAGFRPAGFPPAAAPPPQLAVGEAAEPRPCAGQPGAHGADRYAEGLRRLGIRRDRTTRRARTPPARPAVTAPTRSWQRPVRRSRRSARRVRRRSRAERHATAPWPGPVHGGGRHAPCCATR